MLCPLRSHSLGVCFGQVKTEEKSNEITAIPELLDLLHVKGMIVTIDAMGCQKKITKKITEKEADYLISIKGNQKTMYKEPLIKARDWQRSFKQLAANASSRAFNQR